MRKSDIFIEIQGFTDSDGYEKWRASKDMMYRVSTSGKEKSKDLETKIDELMKQIHRLERIDLEKHFEKLQKTISENSGAINTINLTLTNITQTLTEQLLRH